VAQLKALLFDVDGTMAETERDGHRVAFNCAFKELGLDWEWDDALYGQLLTITGGKERLRYYLDSFNTDFEYGGDLDALIKDLHARKTKHYVAQLENSALSLRPGIERLILEAKSAGLRLAIVTTTTPANVTALVSNTLGKEALDWFECIAAGDVVPAKKPAPDIYDYCLAQMNLDAAECIVFEDSGNGVKSSLAANLPTVVTQNGYTAEDDFSGALIVLDHLGEPALPCNVIVGESLGAPYVSVAVLQDLHQKVS
jgi:HAD superfamily hydrolase (TIGR01509 family)